jgi:hypothetical protein
MTHWSPTGAGQGPGPRSPDRPSSPFHLGQRHLGLGPPAGHVHGAVEVDGRDQGGAGLLLLPGVALEPAQPVVAVSHQRTHAQLLGQRGAFLGMGRRLPSRHMPAVPRLAPAWHALALHAWAGRAGRGTTAHPGAVACCSRGRRPLSAPCGAHEAPRPGPPQPSSGGSRGRVASTRAMNASRPSTPQNWLACPDTTCSTRPATRPWARSAAACSGTTTARWAGSAGAPPDFGVTSAPEHGIDPLCGSMYHFPAGKRRRCAPSR